MKEIKPRIVLTLAILFCGSLICFFLFSGNKKKADLIEILVAAQDIPRGTLIKPEMVVKTLLPVNYASSDEIDDLQEVNGLTTIVPIPKGKPIVYTQFEPTEKAQAPSRGHNPQNYTLAVNETFGAGKLFKPGTNFYSWGKVAWDINVSPIVVFPRVQLVYESHQPLKPFGYARNSTLLFTITPSEAQDLKKLSGQPLQLLLRGLNGDEIISVAALKD